MGDWSPEAGGIIPITGPAPSGDTTGATDLGNINAYLAAASAKPVSAVTLEAGGVYYVNGPIVVYPNQQLISYGATTHLVTNTKTQLVTNHGYSSGPTAGDTAIAIRGGSWIVDTANDAAAGPNRHVLFAYGVTGWTVVDVSVTRADATDVGRDIDAYNCSNVRIDNCTHSTGGVGVWIEGTGSGWSITHQYGSTGDDFVGVSSTDFAPYIIGTTYGDTFGITIEDIFPTSCVNGVKILVGNNAGAALNLRSIKVRNVVGTNTAPGSMVYVGGDNGSANTINGNILGLLIDGVYPSASALGATITCQQTGTGVIYELEIAHVPFSDLATAKYTIGFTGGVNNVNLIVDSVTIRDCYWTSYAGLNTTIQPVRFDSGATGTCLVRHCNLDNISAALTSLSVCAQIGTAATTVTTFRATNCRMANTNTTGNIFDNHSATAPVCTNAYFTNIDLNRAQALWNFKGTTNVWMDQIIATTITEVGIVTAGGTVHLINAQGLTGTHCCLISNAGTLTGLIQSVGTGVPGIAGQVGDQYSRSDGTHGGVTVVYQCTVAGTDGSATWTGIL